MTWGINNYSATPGSNTAINGINIAPGCPSSSVGPALRQLMADIANAIQGIGGQFVPTGSIFHFTTATPPSGFLTCDGSAVSRTTYANLFALISTNYGSGDGSTTFNLPDLRGRVIAGYDAANATSRLTKSVTQGVSASAVGNTGGEQTHALAIAELASHSHTDSGHTHTVTDPGHTHNAASFFVESGVGSEGWLSGGNPGGGQPTQAISATASATTGLTIAAGNAALSSTGSGTAHNVVQPTIIMLPCIKT